MTSQITQENLNTVIQRGLLPHNATLEDLKNLIIQEEIKQNKIKLQQYFEQNREYINNFVDQTRIYKIAMQEEKKKIKNINIQLNAYKEEIMKWMEEKKISCINITDILNTEEQKVFIDDNSIGKAVFLRMVMCRKFRNLNGDLLRAILDAAIFDDPYHTYRQKINKIPEKKRPKRLLSYQPEYKDLIIKKSKQLLSAIEDWIKHKNTVQVEEKQKHVLVLIQKSFQLISGVINDGIKISTSAQNEQFQSDSLSLVKLISLQKKIRRKEKKSSKEEKQQAREMKKKAKIMGTLLDPISIEEEEEEENFSNMSDEEKDEDSKIVPKIPKYNIYRSKEKSQEKIDQNITKLLKEYAQYTRQRLIQCETMNKLKIEYEKKYGTLDINRIKTVINASKRNKNPIANHLPEIQTCVINNILNMVNAFDQMRTVEDEAKGMLPIRYITTDKVTGQQIEPVVVIQKLLRKKSPILPFVDEMNLTFDMFGTKEKEWLTNCADAKQLMQQIFIDTINKISEQKESNAQQYNDVSLKFTKGALHNTIQKYALEDEEIEDDDDNMQEEVDEQVTNMQINANTQGSVI